MEIEEAVRLVTESVIPIEDTLEIPSEEALGFIAGRDLVSEVNVPSFTRSAMDGYAVKASDVKAASPDNPVRLKVKGEILAGESRDIGYSPFSAVRIMTGGMMPEGYDAVVRQEDTDYGEDNVRIETAVPSGMNYCPAGEEIKAGDTVIPEGCCIGRIQTGLMAALGITKVCIRRPARIAVLSTGSELASVGEPLKPGQIYNSISQMLASSILEEKLEVVYRDICPDDSRMLKEKILRGLEMSDLLITTGGVSAGKKDLIPEVLDDLNARRLFSGVNIQPGTPTIASILENKLILSLSGNPYAAIVNFDIYFRAAVSKLMGSDHYLYESEECILHDRYDKVNRMRRLVRALVKGGRVYLPVSGHMSSVFGNMQQCNCYMDVPAGKSISPGDTVRIIRTG